MLSAEFPAVVALRNATNLGFAKATNRGIKASRARYVCMLNSDVTVFPTTIATLLSFMETHPAVGLMGPKILNPDLTLQPSCRTFPNMRASLYRALALDTIFPTSKHFAAHRMTWWKYDDTREVDVLSGCFWFARRSALDGVGDLDPRFFMYGEDIDFCRRFHLAQWTVVFNPSAEAIHYGGASSANAPARFAVEMQRADVQYFLKYDGILKATGHLVLAAIRYWLRFLLHSLLWFTSPGRRSLHAQKVRNSVACAMWLTRTLWRGPRGLQSGLANHAS